MSLQRMSGVEIPAGDFITLPDKVAEEAWPDAGRREMALHGAVLQRAGADVFVDLLHLENLAFHPGNLRNAGDLALAVRHALELDDDPDRGRDLPANAR